MTADESEKQQTPEKHQESLGFFDLLQSMWAGLIGVQSGKNRERDFEKGKPIQFIAAGIITTLIFLAIFITLAIQVSK